MGSSLNKGPFSWDPNIVWHPYEKDPQRDSNLENYPYTCYPQSVCVGALVHHTRLYAENNAACFKVQKASKTSGGSLSF